MQDTEYSKASKEWAHATKARQEAYDAFIAHPFDSAEYEHWRAVWVKLGLAELKAREAFKAISDKQNW